MTMSGAYIGWQGRLNKNKEGVNQKRLDGTMMIAFFQLAFLGDDGGTLSWDCVVLYLGEPPFSFSGCQLRSRLHSRPHCHQQTGGHHRHQTQKHAVVCLPSYQSAHRQQPGPILPTPGSASSSGITENLPREPACALQMPRVLVQHCISLPLRRKRPLTQPEERRF